MVCILHILGNGPVFLTKYKQCSVLRKMCSEVHSHDLYIIYILGNGPVFWTTYKQCSVLKKMASEVHSHDLYITYIG